MSAAAIAASIAILRDAFPRQDFPDRSVALYTRELSDLDGARVATAVRRLIRRSTWLPSIAEIRMEVAEDACQLPTPAEAWSLASMPASDLHGIPAPELVVESINACGGRWTITHSERPEIVRSQFLKDYEARRAEAILGAMEATPRRRQLEGTGPLAILPAKGGVQT